MTGSVRNQTLKSLIPFTTGVILSVGINYPAAFASPIAAPDVRRKLPRIEYLEVAGT